MSNLVQLVNSNGMISSKIVAEKFGKRHNDVLRDIRKLTLKLSNDFRQRNFAHNEINTLTREGTEVSEVMMSRDGFSILAMGFTGEAAIKWKERFLDAFNQMERAITSEIPALKATISKLEQERRALPAPKKPHGNKGLVWVPVARETLFGHELHYRKAPKSDPKYSDESRMEGELNRLSRMSEGMQRKIRELADELALKRRR